MADSAHEYKPILLIDKPKGITSNAALTKIKKIISAQTKCRTRDLPKIGHGGTLDPLATGLLVVGITRIGTRQLHDSINHDKVYECEIDLLKSSVTGDMEAFEQHELGNRSEPTIAEIQELIDTNFTGDITQIPPIYSALKIDGAKACDLARASKEVKMKPRIITLHDVQILEYSFPALKLRVSCSKGTYIRTLGMDIGKELGLYGTLSNLRRIKSGDYAIENAYDLDSLKYNDLLCCDE